jgi:hypothetical protein
VIEVAIIVAAGAASAGGFGSLAWWTSSRHAVGRADAITARAISAGRRGLGEVVEGTVVARVDYPRPARPSPSQRGLCPRCGTRPIQEGAMAPGVDGRPVQVCGACLAPTASTDAAIRGALRVDGPSSGACEGRLTLHEDGSTTCHGGRDDCWGDVPGYTHGAPVACRSLSHGCGVCQIQGGAS